LNPIETFDYPVPQAVEAEGAVLGACLSDQAALDTVLEIVSEADFFKLSHRLVFRACQALNAKHKPVDLISVMGQLQADGQLDEAGGALALADLSEKATSYANVAAHAHTVAEKSRLRALIAACGAISQDAYKRQNEASEVLSGAEERILGILAPTTETGFQGMDRLADKHATEINEIRSRQSKHSVPYGFWAMDDHTGGIRPGQLVVIAGRPGTGKSALTMNCIASMAGAGIPVGVMSLEMTTDELLTRVICSEGSLDSLRISTGKAAEAEYQQYERHRQIVAKWPMHICDDGMTQLGKLKSMARSLVRNKGIRVLAVDYLQLLSAEGRHDSREQEVSKISKELKQLAKHLEIGIIACAQLNRKSLEGSSPRKPRSDDLRESGAIEQNADVIFMLHTDAERNPQSTVLDYEILTTKQRGGPTDEKPITFLPEFTRFDSGIEPWRNPRYWKNQRSNG
jgi:replicative DNA helicase